MSVPKSLWKSSSDLKTERSRKLSSAHSSVVLFCSGVPESKWQCSYLVRVRVRVRVRGRGRARGRGRGRVRVRV